ncbi:MAG: hypothetical protein IJK62_10390 [Bacteroidales bacterium]|nr:hypothetical protein [Bacteroidales bacterium]
MNKLALILAVLTAFVLTSCEKENIADVVENNATTNLKHANFVLMQKGYVDEYGNVGDLYVDENDSKNMYLEIYQQPQTRAHEQPDPYDGTLHAVYSPEGWLDRYECIDDPSNCWNRIVNGEPTVAFPTGTTAINVYSSIELKP